MTLAMDSLPQRQSKAPACRCLDKRPPRGRGRRTRASWRTSRGGHSRSGREWRPGEVVGGHGPDRYPFEAGEVDLIDRAVLGHEHAIVALQPDRPWSP